MESLYSADRFKDCKVVTTTLTDSSGEETLDGKLVSGTSSEPPKPKELPKAVQDNRAGQLKVRAQASQRQGQFCKSTDRKPKGSRNVPKQGKKASKSSEKAKRDEIIDFNSSFDDIESKFLAGGASDSEKEESPKERESEVVFRTPMKRFTFNPKMTSFEELASHLFYDSSEAAGPSKLEAARWTERQCSPPPSSIYSVTDSDYASVDFDFVKEPEPLLSPIKKRKLRDGRQHGRRRAAGQQQAPSSRSVK